LVACGQPPHTAASMAMAAETPQYREFSQTAQSMKGPNIDNAFLLEIWTGADCDLNRALNHLLDTADDKVRKVGQGGGGGGGGGPSGGSSHKDHKQKKDKKSHRHSADSFNMGGGGFDDSFASMPPPQPQGPAGMMGAAGMAGMGGGMMDPSMGMMQQPQGAPGMMGMGAPMGGPMGGGMGGPMGSMGAPLGQMQGQMSGGMGMQMPTPSFDQRQMPMSQMSGMQTMLPGGQMQAPVQTMLPGAQMQAVQTMLPGGQQDQLAQQIRDTERQMAEMQEKIQMAQMNLQTPGAAIPNSMGSPGYGGTMGGVDYEDDQSDSGSENDWWNQPSSYGQGGMQGSYTGAGMQGQGSYNGANMQVPGSYGTQDPMGQMGAMGSVPGSMDPYATQPGYQQGGMPGSMDPYSTQPGYQQSGPGGYGSPDGGMQMGMNYGGNPQMGMMAGGGGPQQYWG